jgi:hypothetical protein
LARWTDELSAQERQVLDALHADLLAMKSAGWSVVRGLRELVIRPPDRAVGKVGLTLRGGTVHGAFFDGTRRIWTHRRDWAVSAGPAAEILDWARAIIADPDSSAYAT